MRTKFIKVRKLITTAVVIAMITTLISPVLSIESKATVSKLTIGMTRGALRATIDGEEYLLTEEFVANEYGLGAGGTIWVILRDGSILWYSYHYQDRAYGVWFNLWDYGTSLIKDDMDNVVGYINSEGQTIGIPSVDTIKEVSEAGIISTIETPITSDTLEPGVTIPPRAYYLILKNQIGEMMLEIIYDYTDTYKITEQGVGKEAGFDSIKTLWLILENGSLLWYSYEYQGSDDIQFHLLDTGVTELVRENNKVVGYVKDNQNKNIPSIDELRSVISEGIEGIKIPITVSSEIPTATATPEPTVTVTPEPTATATPEPTVTVTPEPTATAIPVPTATATPKPMATATPKPTATAIPTVTAKPTATPKPTVYAYKVKASGSKKNLYNSKGKKVDTVKLKNGKLTYHSLSMKNVSKVEFSKKGNLLVITKKNKLYVINHNTMKKKLISTKVKKFTKKSKGIPTYVIKQSGKKLKVTKY